MNTSYKIIVSIASLLMILLNSCQYKKISIDSLDKFIENTPGINKTGTRYFILVGSVGCNNCIKDIESNIVKTLKNKTNIYIILSPKLKKLTLKSDSTFIPNRFYDNTEFVDIEEKLSYLNVIKYEDMKITSIENVEYDKLDSILIHLSSLK